MTYLYKPPSIADFFLPLLPTAATGVNVNTVNAYAVGELDKNKRQHQSQRTSVLTLILLQGRLKEGAFSLDFVATDTDLLY